MFQKGWQLSQCYLGPGEKCPAIVPTGGNPECRWRKAGGDVKAWNMEPSIHKVTSNYSKSSDITELARLKKGRLGLCGAISNNYNLLNAAIRHVVDAIGIKDTRVGDSTVRQELVAQFVHRLSSPVLQEVPDMELACMSASLVEGSLVTWKDLTSAKLHQKLSKELPGVLPTFSFDKLSLRAIFIMKDGNHTYHNCRSICI
ncbi:hypothetical protein P154DRAFT_565307 [Amniculicola lignicola CBS 123094]|uniref:Uncharacterized protein n=1 Tax=Amniculicola lignicola CBS 123094 TaxID=1392246 RepID=A0A6A5WEC1_9PLEO|nr:hypothetical protein P154DRAFT_565307 [Amniculicola lignicola CBS 123094]